MIYGDEHGPTRMVILRKSQEILAALSGLVIGANPRKSPEVEYKVPCNGITPPWIHPGLPYRYIQLSCPFIYTCMCIGCLLELSVNRGSTVNAMLHVFP